MTQSAFWEIIDAAASQAKGDSDKFIEVLQASLERLTPEDIIAFKVRQQEEMIRSFTWDLWGAAYIINGGCSDDGFEYFRAWLMSRGSEDWEAALKDCQALATMKGVEPDEVELEDMLYVAVEAYEAKTDGGDIYEKLPETKKYPADPAGKAWEEDGDDLEKRFPKLWKKFCGE